MSDQQWPPPPGPQYPPAQLPPWQSPGPYAGPPPAPQYAGSPPPGQYAVPPSQYAGPQYGPNQPSLGWGQLPPQPPKKRSPALVLLGVFGGLALLGVVVVAVGSNLLKGNGEPTVTRPVVTTTTEPTSEATPTASVPVATNSRPTAPVTTRRPTTPTKPKPTDWQVVSGNRLYRAGVQPSVACKESRIGLSTVAKATAYYQQIKRCLDRAWPRQVRAAGYQFRAPNLISYLGNANSPCGNSDRSLSFYCSTNHTIYMDVADDVGYWRQNQPFTRALASHTVAHEYAHSMQSITGILSSYYDVRYEAGSAAKALEFNRRMELQASCLGNVFLGSNRNSYPLRGQLYAQWLYVVNNSGDVSYLPRDHGSKQSHGYWGRRGFTIRNLAACNTFTAPTARVS